MKNKIKKGLVCTALSVLVLSNISNNNIYANPNVITTSKGEIETYAEQFSWYYRMVNGREQMRLWSNVYGYWKTVWIWV